MNSNAEVLYVKGMNITTSDSENEGDEDIWDDSKLNHAYDKALKIANEEVAKRIAMSTNTLSNSKDGTGKNKKGNPIPKTNSTKKESKVEWKAGMACRAVYECDGQEYEAFLLRIINDKECVVRFLGYENTEIVLINSLKPSLGKVERKLQIKEALISDNNGDVTSEFSHDNTEDALLSPVHTDTSSHRKKKMPKKKKNSKPKMNFELPNIPMPPNMGMLRNLSPMDMPIPPPPPMNFTSDRDSEDQAVSSMLLSWYMSGYYTGLYQGMKRARQN